MENVTLSSAVRQNLLSMQSTADMMARTQNRLATGKRVNSALDNPTNFFTASALNSRSSDLMRLQDSVGNAVQTIEAADNGLKAINKLVESAQGTARQALQSAKEIITTFAVKEGGDVDLNIAGASDVDAGITGDIAITTVTGAATTTITTDGKSLDAIATEIAAITNVTATVEVDAANPGEFRLEIDGTSSETFTISGAGAVSLGIDLAAAGAASDGDYVDMNVVGTATADIAALSGASTLDFDIDGTTTSIALTGTESMDDIAALISEIDSLTATVTAGANAGEFSIDVTADNTVTTFSSTGASATALSLTGSLTTESATTPNATRATLELEYNELLKQIDDLTKDASFNGNNFLNGDDLKVIFNETGTSSLTIKGVDTSAKGLGLEKQVLNDFQDNTKIEATLAILDNATTTLRSNASTFGSNLSTVEARKDFTANMINTLETGAANLTLADINQEGANMLALQTRQQLSTTALSMASQADQAVLRLF